MTGRPLVLAGRELWRPAGRPLLMAIVNATPDSFSDPGRYRGAPALAARARELIAEGADLVDVGGESGVTDRPAVAASEEMRRVIPVIEHLAGEDALVSVDTWKAEVARRAIAAGAVLVNDVSGLRDPELAAVCAEGGAGLVLTHTPVAPKKKAFPVRGDVVADVVAFLAGAVERARAAGVAEEGMLVDPGLDLGKTPRQSVELLRRLPEVAALGLPVLVAASRKDFVGAITGRPPSARLAGTLAALEPALAAGAAMLRVHEVAPTLDFLAVRAAARGESRVPERLEGRLRRESPVGVRPGERA